MTRHQLTRRFEQTVGISFAQFALRYRLEGAAAALLHDEAPLKAIAIDWGFVDASHFHHCFTRNFGCTPATYRRTARA
jgi:transcriptional regulator GlxA family with amidase domain